MFVKAAGSALNPDSPRMHRREGDVLARLPNSVPAPGLIGVFDDGDWVALVIEWIDGRVPVRPLGRSDLDRVLGLVDLDVDLGDALAGDRLVHMDLRTDSDAVNAVLAAVAGYFTRQSLMPPPPGLPTVRRFQAAQGAIARRWLGQRCDWT